MRTIIASLLSATALSGVAQAQELVIALSPHVTAEQRQSQGEEIITYLAENLEPGQSAEIIDGYDLRAVATFTVPEGRTFQNPRAKLNANREAARAILTLEPASERAAGDVQFPVNLPGLLRHVGENYDGPLDLVVIGSPLYDMPLEAHASMAGGGVPGDGMIRTTRGNSPFGADGAGALLEGMRVHFAAVDPDWAYHDRHAVAVERFIDLEVSAFGGQLVSFANDTGTVLDRVARGVAAPQRGWTLEETDKREMLIFRPGTAPRTTGRDMERGGASYTGPATVDGEVEIGLYWQCAACDLDLHARASAGAEPLSYLHIESADGSFMKDVRHSATDEAVLEYVVLRGPVDLSALDLWVNFYGGEASGGVDAELRVTIDGWTYIRPLGIAAARGDFGAGRDAVIDRGGDDPAWVAAEALPLLRN